jgi:hypothetical protein
MTINTRGGGVTHAHTHTHTHTRQGAAVQPSVNPVPSRPLVGGLFHRPSCVCVCPLYWVRTARVRVSVGWLCIRQKKRVALSPIHTHTYHIHIHTHRQRQHSAQNGVCCAVSGVCLCACVLLLLLLLLLWGQAPLGA